MNYRIVEEPVARLGAYGEIPIRFEVRSVFEIVGSGIGPSQLSDMMLNHLEKGAENGPICMFWGSKRPV